MRLLRRSANAGAATGVPAGARDGVRYELPERLLEADVQKLDLIPGLGVASNSSA